MKQLAVIFLTAGFFILIAGRSEGQRIAGNSIDISAELAVNYNVKLKSVALQSNRYAAQEAHGINAGEETESMPTEVNPPVISYTAITSPTCTFSGMVITGVTMTDATGVPLTGGNRPRIYYKKNAGSWFSNAGTNTGGTITSSTWNFSIVETDMGGVSGGDIVYYYIIAQDLNATPNVGSNPSAGLVATSVNTVTTHPSSPNTYSLKYNFNGTYTVGAGGNFTTLTAAVNAYNVACAISGPVVFELTDNSYPSETFPISILSHPDASPSHTLTIRPSATASPVISGSVNNPIINLNGAQYIRLDGRQGGSGTAKSLTISNTAGAGVAVQFINDAQNNILEYCMVKAQRQSSFTGTIIFSTAASGTGNDNNSVDNNDICESAGGFSNIGIYSGGTLGKENDNISVTNNNIFNYFNSTSRSAGILVGTNSNSWIISGNHFFQTATRTYTTGNNHYGIYITAGTGYTISNNIVGFANSSGTGTTNMIGNSASLAGFPDSYTASGTAAPIRYIAIAGSFALAGPASSIDGNIIGGFAMYTSSNTATGFGIFCGIYIESGTANIGTNSGNTIGAQTGNNSIYVASTTGGTVVGIRAACIGISAIQNNIIGSITSSGTSNTISGSFTGINTAGLCNFDISNNSIGNPGADNIRVGYTLLAGTLSNAGSLVITIPVGVVYFRGILNNGTGNTANITNNTLRGWVMSCSAAINTGIESSGAMSGSLAAVNVNNNFLGTATANWLNATVENTAFNYAILVSNTAATVYNINNNDIRGTFFGVQNCTAGSLIKLMGASSANSLATISGNTFTNLSFRFSQGNLYFIIANYALSSTSQLFIDNNKIAGNFNATGPGDYHMIYCAMTSVTGAKTSVTNNEFSNITAGIGATCHLYGLYSSFGFTPCLLTLTGNKLNNWLYGNGAMTGIDISNMTGTANCSGNIISNISCQGIIEGIYLNTSASSGLFNLTNNSITGLVSTGAGGYINGASIDLPVVANTTHSNFSNNTISGLSSSDADGTVSGFYLFNGYSTATVSINSNKIYNLSESTNGGYVYGIYNDPTLAGDITYTNNYIGDLRAPRSVAPDPSVAGFYLFMSGGQAKVYYNTIHLTASGIAAQFSTAAVYADAATMVTLRNNIFSNASSHGATGKTVAYWRGDNNLGTYNTASNNNVFYAGTASAQNLIFYDGTNNDQLLSTYKTRVNPRDNLSVNAFPNFAGTIGANANYLHLATTGNCGIASRGSNAGILLATDYDGDSRITSSPFLTDIGADEVSKVNIWTAANSSSWNDTGNWSQGVIPNDVKINVSISAPPAAQPVIATGETFQVGNIIINPGASLTNNGTIKIADSVFAGAGTINNIQAGVVAGSVEMNGSCSAGQGLNGNVFVSNSVKDFTVSNNVSIDAAGQQLNISGALSFGATGKTFITNDNIVLISTSGKTANVGDVTGNLITGKATVERYINTGLVADGRHLKSWQFLSTPTAGQTIFQSWQESGTAPAGYGTIITGTGSGFDITTTAPSMKYYDYGSNAWTGITNTGNLLNDKRGYMLFVRGDRTVTAYNQNAIPTTLRTKGTLYQPTAPPPATSVQGGKFESVGNPYASAIDISYMKNNNLFVNLNNDVTVWDPLLAGAYSLGGYQTLSAANNYEPTAGSTPTAYYPAGVSAPFIQSGQAFFVHSSGSAGSVTFNEACKESSSRLVNRLMPVNIQRQYFRAMLYTAEAVIADGNAVVFDSHFKNIVDADDSYKFRNSGENFGIIREQQNLAVEARNPVIITDTVFYNIANLKKQAYQLRFAPKNMSASGLTAFLIDRYSGIVSTLSLADSSFINISVNNDSLSYAAGRFLVVFKKHSPAPVYTASIRQVRTVGNLVKKPAAISEGVISVYPNPVVNGIIQLHFENQLPGNYHIQLINKSGQTIYSDNIMIDNTDVSRSIKIDKTIATGIYQLYIFDYNEKKTAIQVIIK